MRENACKRERERERGREREKKRVCNKKVIRIIKSSKGLIFHFFSTYITFVFLYLDD